MSKSTIPAAPVYPIETARLSIRLLSAADEALYCGLYMDPDVMRFVGPPLSRERAARSFHKALELTHQQTFGRRIHVLIERATRQAIGISGSHLADAQHGRAEVGTLLRTASHAQRFAPEFCTALFTMAFTRPQVRELWAHVAKDHHAMERLLTGLGFCRGIALPASAVRPAGCGWVLSREAWAQHDKPRVALSM
jgi:RimJ/RimL family protein N-acetyltransferase